MDDSKTNTGRSDASPGAALLRILAGHGHDRSMAAGLAIDARGNPLPMYTYPAIEYLAQLDFSERHVLEFGSGQSTHWWARHAAQVTAVEHDDHWVKRLEAAALPNVTCVFARREDIGTGSDYLAVLPSGQRYDVIALDGLHYHDCAAAARGLLSDGGLLILDNADFYPATCAMLRDRDFLQIDMAGFKPCHLDAQVTSLFFDRGFDVKPRGRQPLPCIGGKDKVSPFDKPRRIAVRNGKAVIY